jgi:chromosome segregation protein
MKLKKIEILGFKSFVDKTVVEFLDGVTTIVGPNGSGKSNIADAIRWVLGEQSVKALRGSKMEDVIFAGTQSRKKVGFAEVNIYFDNSDSSLPVEFSEVVVGRKVYRTGESGYYINGSECRLKDVQELFMDTGISKDGYSIIGQGKIDEILSNKSEERRAIFEEASGIVKYRTRKDEASRKLENTNNDLSRVNDVLNEIENIISTLEKKSEVAKKYLILKDELKKYKEKIFLKSIEENAQNIAKLDSVIETYSQNQATEEQVALEIEKAKMNLKERFDQVTLEIEKTQAKYYEMENESEKTNSKIDILSEKIANSKLNIERLNKEILQDKENIELLEADVIKKEEKKESLSKDKVKFETDLSEKEKALSEIVKNLDTKALEIENVKKEVEDLNNEKSENKIKISSLNATIVSNQKQLELMLKDNDKKISQKDALVIEKDEMYTNLSGKKNELSGKEAVLNELGSKISEASAEKQKIVSKKDTLNQELMTAKSKFNYLNNLEHENEGYYKSVKSVLDYAKDSSMSKVYGTVASVISTSEEYE